MTYKHYNVAVDEPLPFDSGIERSLYLEACYRADNRGIVRTPQSQLSTLTLFSPRTIATVFNTLQDKGLLLRLGHGCYKVILSLEDNHSADNGSFSQQLGSWLSENKDCLVDGELVLPEDADLPKIVLEAIEKELLKLKERFGILAGKNEDGSQRVKRYIRYTIHI